MQMSHVYQPVMLRTLIDRDGRATGDEVAQALLAEDRAQLDYYRQIVKRMPGSVQRSRGIVDYRDGTCSLPGFDEITAAERHELRALALSGSMRAALSAADPVISGFNLRRTTGQALANRSRTHISISSRQGGRRRKPTRRSPWRHSGPTEFLITGELVDTTR
jgi:hypothetical protein